VRRMVCSISFDNRSLFNKIFPAIIVFKNSYLVPYTDTGRWTDFVDKLICARLLTITILTDQAVCAKQK
jgi:hypothetical protein